MRWASSRSTGGRLVTGEELSSASVDLLSATGMGVLQAAVLRPFPRFDTGNDGRAEGVVTGEVDGGDLVDPATLMAPRPERTCGGGGDE